MRQMLIAVALLGLCADSAFAQRVVVRKKAAPTVGREQFVEYDHWSVSFSRVFSPATFDLDHVYESEAGARQRAERLIQWSQTQPANQRIAVIEIVGDPSVRLIRRDANDRDRRDGGRDDWNDRDRDGRDGRRGRDYLRDHSQALKASYDAARSAKSEAVRRNDSLTRREFNNVNQLIEKYNNLRDDYRRESGYYLAQYQRIAPLTPTDLHRPLANDNRGRPRGGYDYR